jgi:prophage regulatory protein
MKNELAVLSDSGRSALSKNMDTLITLKEIGQLLGLSRSSVYVLIKSADFPKPYSLTARCQRWEKLEVEAWLLSRKGTAPEPRMKQSKASNVLTINGIEFIGATNGK